jgi:hypothetical protein
LDVNLRVGPLKQTALLANPMKETKPEPDVFWLSAQ